MTSIDQGSQRRLPPRGAKGGRPTREVAARLNNHILHTAFEQFVKLGAEGPSMDIIAVAANVSKRTLYTRFGSREELLVAAIEHGVVGVNGGAKSGHRGGVKAGQRRGAMTIWKGPRSGPFPYRRDCLLSAMAAECRRCRARPTQWPGFAPPVWRSAGRRTV
ncbi:TetR/AcrR family transcriptional regulator [Sphingomonas oryzagri]